MVESGDTVLGFSLYIVAITRRIEYDTAHAVVVYEAPKCNNRK